MSLTVAGLDYRVLGGAGNELLPDALCGPQATSRVLGAQILSQRAVTAEAGFPVQSVCMPRLGDAAAPSGASPTPWSAELWLSDRDCRQGRVGSLRFSCDGALLFGTLQVYAHELPADADFPLQQATAAAYAQIFELLEAEAYPHVWRVWNYLSDINDETDGLERYRQFNVGRHQAFEAHGRLNAQAVPAACALGTRDRAVPLNIAFLAAREASRVIENPRQVAAYEYPTEYGPRSPTFARAALAQMSEQAILFVSGTASIVGHASIHIGDVVGQTQETLVNIQALLDEASRLGSTWQLPDLSYRAYLRHAMDYPAVQAALAQRLGSDVRIEFVQADICRAELLVEIEAVGVLPAAAITDC